MTESTALAAARTGGFAAVVSAANNAFVNAAKKEGVTDGFWLRMNGKTGAWLTNLPGVTELDAGTKLVFDIWHAEQIWQGFDSNNKLYNGPKVTLVSGADLPDPPPTPGVKWKKHIRVMVATPSDGKQMALTCKADNPYREIWKLVKRYGELLVRFPDAGSKTGYMRPIIEIDSKSYDMMAKVETVVTDKATGAKSIVEEEQKITNYREVFKVTDDANDWISEADMSQILEDANLAEEEAKLTPPVDKTVTIAAQEQQQSVQEIIPPAAKAGGAADFRRARAGQVGIRT